MTITVVLSIYVPAPSTWVVTNAGILLPTVQHVVNPLNDNRCLH